MKAEDGVLKRIQQPAEYQHPRVSLLPHREGGNKRAEGEPLQLQGSALKVTAETQIGNGHGHRRGKMVSKRGLCFTMHDLDAQYDVFKSK